jgi:hypothetical protein
MYSQESIGALKQLFQWSIVEAADIDHEKYLLSKKISEVSEQLDQVLAAVYASIDDVRCRSPS